MKKIKSLTQNSRFTRTILVFKINKFFGTSKNPSPLHPITEIIYSGHEVTKQHECKAMLLSFFDKASKDTLKIDLWTSEMQIAEMDRFFYQTLRAMGDTYFKATKTKNRQWKCRNLFTTLAKKRGYFRGGLTGLYSIVGVTGGYSEVSETILFRSLSAKNSRQINLAI